MCCAALAAAAAAVAVEGGVKRLRLLNKDGLTHVNHSPSPIRFRPPCVTGVKLSCRLLTPLLTSVSALLPKPFLSRTFIWEDSG